MPRSKLFAVRHNALNQNPFHGHLPLLSDRWQKFTPHASRSRRSFAHVARVTRFGFGKRTRSRMWLFAAQKPAGLQPARFHTEVPRTPQETPCAKMSRCECVCVSVCGCVSVWVGAGVLRKCVQHQLVTLGSWLRQPQ